MIMGEVKPKIIISKEWRLVGHHRQRQGQGPESHGPLSILGLVWFIFFGHSLSLITLKYHVCLVLSLTSHHSIFFTLFVSPTPITWCSFFSFFFFSSVPKLIEPSEKKKKKKKNQKPRTNRTSERRRKKKKKKRRRSNPGEERTEQPTQRRKEKKKSKGGQKVRLSTVCESPMCV